MLRGSRSSSRHSSRSDSSSKSSEKETAAHVLDAYGKDKSNIPRGNANCQDWTTGALGALERERLAPRGTRDYWDQNIGRASSDVGDRLRRDGGSWVPRTTVDSRDQGPADATFGREQARRPVGRLNLDKFSGLSGSSKSRR